MSKRSTCLILLTVALGLVPAARAAFTPDTDASLLGHWKFDEGTGTAAADASGNGINGTLTGGVLWAEGLWGSAVQFNGLDSYVETGNTENLAKWTLSVWVMSPAAPGSTSPTGPVHREANYQINWNHTDANFRGAAAMSVGGTWYSASFGPMEADTWYHLVATYDGETLSAYKDGALITANTSPSGNPAAETNTLKFGRHASAAQFMTGTVDEIHIFKRALAADEVKAFPPKPPKVKARKPDPADGKIGVSMPLLQWTKGDTAIFHDIYVGTSPNLTAADKVGHQAWAVFYYALPLLSGQTYYWRVDEIDATGTVFTGDVWSFMTEPTQAYAPKPVDGSKDLLPAQTLSWSSPTLTLKHQVYFSSVQSDVAGGAAAADKGQVSEAKFSTGVLRSSTTYFWRVDEIKSGGAVLTGPVWSFTTADGVAKKIVRQYWTGIAGGTVADLTNNPNYPSKPTGTELLDSFQGPTDSIDFYGTRMYGWLTPPQTGEYTFYIASDDASELWLSTDADPANASVVATVATYTAAQAWTANASQKSAPVTLQAGQKYFIQALHKEGSGGDNLAVAWSGPGMGSPQVIKAEYVDTFALPALQAYSPRPLNGAVEASFDGSLSWNAGEKAQKHDVYFGEDKDAVAAADTTSPLYKGQQSGATFEAGSLEWGKTYYWRVDEINPAEADSPWKGNVWSFTTANFILVDDMESYNDDDNRIYDAWLDNFGDDSGSTVGNDPAPFAEQAIVHGGKQSLPMAYNNAGSQHFFSETVRTFDTAQNWTVNDVNALSLWVRGYPALTPVTVTESGGKMSLTGGGTDIWNNSDDFTFAYKTLSGDGSIVARVTNIGTGTNGWAKGGVMIRASLNGGSPFTDMVITGAATSGNGASFQYRLAADGACAASDATAAVNPPYWVKLTRQGDNLSAFISANGTSWTVMGNPQTIAMTGPVYLGICVTSHAAGEQRTFQFENITTTGSVSGSWQGAQINAARFNAVAPLYVVVEDSSAKSAVVSDPALVNASAWTQWKIPLTSFTGVNLSKVKKMYLGVGDRKSTTPGGTGRIFLDDIRVTRP